MSERELKLEGLSALLGSSITPGHISETTLSIFNMISALMGGFESERVGIEEDKFFDTRYDYDFTRIKDTVTYYRGEEVYERPCGWKRYGLKVEDKYPDGNAWLGGRGFCTSSDSVATEWPVSYHGTSRQLAQGIILTQYRPGSRAKYGRGIYSTPYMAEAVQYTEIFTSESTGFKYQVVLQNRVNPTVREIHRNGQIWLVPIPEGLSEEEERQIAEKAIRPYALLMKRL